MKSAIIQQIKETLLKSKLSILEKRRADINIDIEGDEVDIIQGKIIANVQSQLSARDAGKLRSIENALTKIEEGSFGLCEECGEEIAEKRLLINPSFINCVGCSEQLEAESKKYVRNA